MKDRITEETRLHYFAEEDRESPTSVSYLPAPIDDELLELFFQQIDNDPELVDQVIDSVIDNRDLLIELLKVGFNRHAVSCHSMPVMTVIELAEGAISLNKAVYKSLLANFIGETPPFTRM